MEVIVKCVHPSCVGGICHEAQNGNLTVYFRGDDAIKQFCQGPEKADTFVEELIGKKNLANISAITLDLKDLQGLPNTVYHRSEFAHWFLARELNVPLKVINPDGRIDLY